MVKYANCLKRATPPKKKKKTLLLGTEKIGLRIVSFSVVRTTGVLTIYKNHPVGNFRHKH